MKRYRWTLDLSYEVDAEDEEDAMYQLVEVIQDGSIYFFDEGELAEIDEDNLAPVGV